jgi:uncharacterized protein YndB with AHSA1/START domain
VEIEIQAPPEVVWQLVTDPQKMGEFAREYEGGAWDPPHRGPALGATFTGHNRRGATAWHTIATVVECAEQRVFAFVVGDISNPSATWRYQFHPTKGGGTRLAESCTIGTAASPLTAAIADRPDREAVIVANRTAEHLANIEATLRALKHATESPR